MFRSNALGVICFSFYKKLEIIDTLSSSFGLSENNISLDIYNKHFCSFVI